MFLADRRGHLTKRIVVDYRADNKNMQPVAFRMPDALQIFNNLEGGEFFGCCDLAMGYNQVKLSTRMQQILAVVGPDGCYYPTRLPLGPSPAPAFFQKQTASVFEDVCDGVFIDDLVEVLGFQVSKQGRKPTPRKVEQLKQWPELESKDDLVSFLAFVNYLREFIPDYQRHRGPLAPYTKKHGKSFTQYQHDNEAQHAVKALKNSIAVDVPLRSIDFKAARDWRNTGRPVVILCDASRFGRSYTIAQAERSGGPLRPCVVKGVSFNETEQAWSVLEQELSAVKLFVEDGFRYVEGLESFLMFDHENLGRLDDLVGNQRVQDKVLRWLEAVKYKLDSSAIHRVYISGIINVIADAASRHP
ncbi:unnamed protein product, partial [Amoebophrya sp. A120]|eukprot:GSA120T00025369001.1